MEINDSYFGGAWKQALFSIKGIRRKKHQTPYNLTVFGALYFNAEKGNKDYRSRIRLKLDGRQRELFDKICDLLENLALESGNFLEDEVKYFICYTQRFDEDFRLLSREDMSKMNVFRYDAIESKLVHAKYTEKDFRTFAQFLKTNYKKKETPDILPKTTECFAPRNFLYEI